MVQSISNVVPVIKRLENLVDPVRWNNASSVSDANKVNIPWQSRIGAKIVVDHWNRSVIPACMTCESLGNRDWKHIVDRLGGRESLETGARDTKAFLRARAIENAVDLLRMILAYCLGARGLRCTAAWANAVGLADISNVALLYRLRQCGDWLALLIGQTLAFDSPRAAQGRLIRLIDATTVPKAGTLARRENKLWRIHSAFDLPSERFGFFELTDEKGGERLDRIPVVEGEIRIGDRAYLQPDRMGELLDAGADIVVRAGWKNARWLGPDGNRSICSLCCAKERRVG